MTLDGADAAPVPGRIHHDFVAGAEVPVEQGAGHDRAGSLDGERPVHPHAGPAQVGDRRVGHRRIELLDELVDPLAGQGLDRDDYSILGNGAGRPLLYLGQG